MSCLAPILVWNGIPNLLVMNHFQNTILFRVQERGQVSAARLYPRIFVPVESRIRYAVNRMGETILVQVRCLRFDRDYQQ